MNSGHCLSIVSFSSSDNKQFSGLIIRSSFRLRKRKRKSSKKSYSSSDITKNDQSISFIGCLSLRGVWLWNHAPLFYCTQNRAPLPCCPDSPLSASLGLWCSDASSAKNEADSRTGYYWHNPLRHAWLNSHSCGLTTLRVRTILLLSPRRAEAEL